MLIKDFCVGNRKDIKIFDTFSRMAEVLIIVFLRLERLRQFCGLSLATHSPGLIR